MRDMTQLTPSMEDYLEAILELSEREDVVRVTDIATRLKIAKASVTQALNNLKDLKLVTQDRYGPVWLTDKGRAYATAVRRRHRVLLHFLTEVLGVDPRTAERDACQMEHSISSTTLEHLLAFLEAHTYIKPGTEMANWRSPAKKEPARRDEPAVGERAKKSPPEPGG
ncbi:MAG: metal-dependent transcriptional regulator [Bacillota bacterium]